MQRVLHRFSKNSVDNVENVDKFSTFVESNKKLKKVVDFGEGR